MPSKIPYSEDLQHTTMLQNQTQCHAIIHTRSLPKISIPRPELGATTFGSREYGRNQHKYPTDLNKYIDQFPQTNEQDISKYHFDNPFMYSGHS